MRGWSSEVAEYAEINHGVPREFCMPTRREILIKAGVASAAILGGRLQSAFAMASQPKTPVIFDVPRNSCDCHTHIFGDPQRFPFFVGRTYTPESASVVELQKMHRALHIDRVVVVQPSVYGTDNSCTLDAIPPIGTTARGVAVIGPQTTEAQLDEMHRRGIRGIRINLETSGIEDPSVAQATFQSRCRCNKASPQLAHPDLHKPGTHRRTQRRSLRLAQYRSSSITLAACSPLTVRTNPASTRCSLSSNPAKLT